MILFQSTDETAGFEQQLLSPSVYLDHWALREISGSTALSTRLSRALRLSGGTLTLSWLNVVEFTKVTDEAQRRKADCLLNTIYPNVFWLNPDFLTVARSEHATSSLTPATHSDIDMAGLCLSSNLCCPGAEGFPTESIFNIVQRVPGLCELYEHLADEIVTQIRAWRREYDERQDVRSALKFPLWPQDHARDTRLIVRHLLAPFLKDKLRPINRNNVIDLTHAVVPVSYCDYVLLDGQWTAAVDDLRRRVAASGLSLRIAKAFSKRRNGINAFLTHLEETVTRHS